MTRGTPWTGVGRQANRIVVRRSRQPLGPIAPEPNPTGRIVPTEAHMRKMITSQKASSARPLRAARVPLNGGLLVVTLGLLILLAACNGASGSISVSLNPTTATVTPNQTVTFTASVTGASNPDVTWAATCGTITGTVNSVTYTAPASAATCTVTVTSVSDSSKTATATVQVQASTGSIAGMNIPSAVVATVTQIFG